MRPIKFRAWWKDTLEPIPDFMEQYNIEVLDGKDDNPFIYSQFIGQHDKNGKEIYEGDIVEGNHGVKAIIEWTQEFGRWSMRWSDGSTTPISWHVRNATVIGKVHEHSDLLK